jgi:predicted RNA-binding Zn ribbon-like protein
MQWRYLLKRYATLLVTLLLVLIVAFSSSSNAQKRSKRRTAKPTPTPTPVVDMRPEATQVAEQIKNVTKFLYIYGKVQNSLEIADEQAKRGQTDAKIVEENKKSKDLLVVNITGLRTGINNLLKGWEGNTRVQTQALRLAKASDAVAVAEQNAAAGRYREAADALVIAVERMTDTMISMKQP